MRNLKRALSLALAALMLIGMMVVSAGAATKDFTDSDEIQHKEAVNVMTTLNVVSGKDDGSYFAPNDTFTREEMAKVVSYVMNGGVEPVVGTKVTPTYSDIKGIWSEKYIEYCTSMGIIAGDGSGKFNPTGTLTAEQCAKMFLTAMGYDAKVFGFVGNNWAINVGRYANEAGLYEELGDIVASDPISRDDAMQMAYNAVQATMMKRSWSQDLTTGQLTETYVPWTETQTINNVSVTVNRTLLLDKFNANVYEGVLSATGDYDLTLNTQLGDANADSVQNSDGFVVTVDRINGTTNPADEFYFEYKDQDMTSLMGQYVKVLYDAKKETVYGLFPVAGKNTVVETAASLTDYSGLTNKVKIDGTTYSLESDIRTIVGNGTTAVVGNTNAVCQTYTSNLQSADKVVFIDNDGNGKFDVALVTPVDVAKVTFLNDTNVTFTPVKNNATLHNNAQLVEDVILSEGLATNDYAVLTPSYYADADTLTKVDVASGTVSGVRNPIVAGQAPYQDYQIGDTWVKIANNNVPNSNIKSGSTVDYVAVNNVLFYIKLTSGATLNDVAVIYQMAKTTTDHFGSSHLEAKVVFTDGTTKTITVDGLYSSYDDTTNEYDGTVNSDAISNELSYVGVPLSYKVNNSGNYEFYKLTNTTDNKAGFDTVMGYEAGGIGATFTSNQWTINGTLVADNAVIVVRSFADQNTAGTNAVTTLSGAEFKKVLDASKNSGINKFNTTDGAYALVGKDADGFTRVMFAVVEATTTATSGNTQYGYNTTDKKFTLGISTGDSYGYLTKDSWTETIDGANYNCFEIWNGTETVTVKEKATAKSYSVRSVIAFDNVGDGIIKNVSKVGAAGAITAVNSGSIEIDGRTYTVTDKTVIMNVNDADKVGVSGSATPLASEIGNSGVYYDNAYYVLSSNDDEIVALVVDVANNSIYNAAARYTVSSYASEAAFMAALSNELTNGTNPLVVVDGNINAATSITVPSAPVNKTLVINGNVTLGANWTVYGALAINGNLDLNGKDLNGTGTVNGETIDLGSTISGSVTVTFKNAVVSGAFNLSGGKLIITNGVTNAGGTLTVAGGDLTVNGATTSNVAVSSGNATLGPVVGDLTVTGGTVITGNVTGNVDASSSASVTTGTVSGDVDASDNANVTTGTVSGDVTTSGNASVTTGGTTTYAQTVALRGSGPDKDGAAQSFNYDSVYTAAGVSLENGTTLKVNLDTLVSFANDDGATNDTTYGGNGSHSARYHLTQMSGSLGKNALFVGLAFGAPSELTNAAKVKVTLNGSVLTNDGQAANGANEIFTLASSSVSGTGSDTLDNAFVQYVPFALAGTEDSSNTADSLKIADGSYAFAFTWLDAEGNVLGTSSCTITRTSVAQ